MVGMTMTSTTVGTTIASTTAGTTMAATVIAGHINHGHDKHGRGIPKAGLYLYFACLYDHYSHLQNRLRLLSPKKILSTDHICQDSENAEAMMATNEVRR
jgi:hypothetical protein